MRQCTKTLGGSLGASLLALMWDAIAEAGSNSLITPPIPAAGSCRVTCSIVNSTSQTQAIMGVAVHDATDVEVSSACPNIPDGATCSATTTARSVGKSPFTAPCGRSHRSRNTDAPAERPCAKRLDLGIELGAHPGDLGLRHAVEPERLHEIVDLAGGDAVNVRLLHHPQQRPLRPPARLQQRGEVAARLHLRDRELDRADPRIRRPHAVAVAVPGALAGALMVGLLFVDLTPRVGRL